MQTEEFSEFVESMIITKGFDITETEPKCSFDVKLTNIPEELQKIQLVANKTLPNFNSEHIADILSIIEYLLNRPYVQFVNYIHIIDSEKDDQTYYCKITNNDFNSKHNNILTDMYLLYKPKLWDKVRSQLLIKNNSLWERFIKAIKLNLVWKRGARPSNISFEISPMTTITNFYEMSDFITLINCFSFIFLSMLRNNSLKSRLLTIGCARFSLEFISKGIAYSVYGLVFSNLIPPATNIMFNSIHIYTNFFLYYGR